jgi:hypothetical protein
MLFFSFIILIYMVFEFSFFFFFKEEFGRTELKKHNFIGKKIIFGKF